MNVLLGDRRDQVIATNGWRYRRVPFIFITPRARADVASLAERIFEEHYEGLEALRSIDLALFARLIGGDGAGHGDLLSYLFFAPEFATALIELGRRTRTVADRSHRAGRALGAPGRRSPQRVAQEADSLRVAGSAVS